VKTPRGPAAVIEEFRLLMSLGNREDRRNDDPWARKPACFYIP